MKRLAIALTFAAACSLAAQERPAGPPKPEAQLAAMKKLEYMAGTWRGEGWMQMGPMKTTFRGSEIVTMKLNGVALLVEGAFFGKAPGSDVEVPVHTTLGVIAYDPKAKKYNFASWLATGGSGEHELVVTDNGWHWELQPPNGGTVRFTTTFANGEWLEIGERSADGTKWQKFFEMKLKKE